MPHSTCLYGSVNWSIAGRPSVSCQVSYHLIRSITTTTQAIVGAIPPPPGPTTWPCPPDACRPLGRIPPNQSLVVLVHALLPDGAAARAAPWRRAPSPHAAVIRHNHRPVGWRVRPGSHGLEVCKGGR